MRVLLCLMLGLTLCVATSALGATYGEQYEMTVSPDQLAGVASGTVANQLVVSAQGSGSTFAGGIMTYLDADDIFGANYGYSGNNAALLNGGNYTVDFRIKVLADQAPLAGKSFSFSNQNGRGRGLQLNLGTAKFVSNSVIGEGNVDLSNWIDLRFIMRSDDTESLYVLGNAVPIVSIACTGATGQSGILTTPGFALGAHGGGSTTMANFQLDWVRIAAGTDPTATYDLIPEPSSVLALATGLFGLAGFAIRRRRA